jgi:alpha-beta hydrolase superfamily lysophospholipase
MYPEPELVDEAVLEQMTRELTAADEDQVSVELRFQLLLASVPSALLLGFTFLHSPVWETEPWKTIAEENTPGASPIDAPVLVVQGGEDHIVDPQITERFVEQLCAKGETAALRLYPGVGHLNTGHDAAPDVAAWIVDRFAAEPAPTTCGA